MLVFLLFMCRQRRIYIILKENSTYNKAAELHCSQNYLRGSKKKKRGSKLIFIHTNKNKKGLLGQICLGK